MSPRALLVVCLLGVGVWLGLSHLRDRDETKGGDEVAGPDRRRGGDGGEPGVARPLASLAGRAVDVELLTMRPAEQFLGEVDREADDYQLAVERAGARFDPHLAAAAREMAAQTASLGAMVPDGAMTFLLHAAGAPEPTAMQFLVRTNSPDPGEIDDAVAGALTRSKSREVRVGVGEASAAGRKLDRIIVVVVSDRAYELEPTPRRAPPATRWPVRGLAPGWRHLEASVLYPDGAVDDLDVTSSGDRFEVDVPTGEAVGTVAVSIDGDGPSGPGKLLQLTVEVGQPLPTSIQVLVPPGEEELQDLESAERFALELLNMDRRRYGLPALALDPALAEVARAHSREMRDADFFGHRSPTTGLHPDRLRAAGYQASASGENVALNDSLAEAEAALMASVGHRKNILSDRYSHAGVGLARRADGDRVEWFVTQLFARKVETIDPAAARAQLLDQLNQQRAARGAGALFSDAGLAAVAQRRAGDATSGAIDGLPGAIGEEAAELVDRGVMVAVQSFHHLTDFQVPDAVLEPELTMAGVGVVQREDSGRIGVVLIVAR
jgi:uncharacterized protein YkwD